jgi:quinol monooxygenase YgiN
VFYVTLTITVPAAVREDIVKVFWSLLGPLRVEPGCLACRLYQEVGSAERLLYVEAWETREQLERHMRSARYERLLAIMEAATQPPALRYQEVCGTRGLEYLEAVRLGSPPPGRPAPDQTNQE